MAVLKTANLALAFLLELCALGAVAYWGIQVGPGIAFQAILGVGAPLIIAIVWGLFIAPKAFMRVPAGTRLLLRLVVYAAAAGALALAGQPVLAIGMAVLVAANEALLLAWGADDGLGDGLGDATPGNGPRGAQAP